MITMPYYNSFITKLNQTSLKELTLLLLGFSWLSGLGFTLAGFGHWFYPEITLLLLSPVLVGLSISWKVSVFLLHVPKWFKYIALFLSVIWISHFIQVWVPETGFDALWYHLPVAQLVIQHHGLVYESSLYQSANPLWSDLFFIAGFQIFGILGAKLVAYGFGVCLMLVTWQVSRLVLNRTWSLAVLLTVSTFQVVTWQSASFYIDVANAFWLLSAVWLLLLHFQTDHTSHQLVRSAVLLGASLATKLFSILLLPVMGGIVWLSSKSARQWKNTCTYLLASMVVVLPFYLFTSAKTGNPFFAIQLHVEKLGQIGGETNLIHYLWLRTLTLPWSVIKIDLVRDYVWIGLPILIFTIISQLKQLKSNQTVVLLALFSVGEWLVWWYVPPLSSRYAIAGFVTIVIVGLWSVKQWMKFQSNRIQKMWWAVFGLSILLQCLPRIYVNYRSLKYLLGFQNQQQYLSQFYDGWTDPYLDQWYK